MGAGAEFFGVDLRVLQVPPSAVLCRACAFAVSVTLPWNAEHHRRHLVPRGSLLAEEVGLHRQSWTVFPLAVQGGPRTRVRKT